MGDDVFHLPPGAVFSCLSIPVTLVKQSITGPDGRPVLKCGFRVGGGIDQDFRLSPQGFTDNGIYITDITPNGPACRAGLRVGDKILQCNGYDFTIVTHKKAVEYIQRYDILNLLVARRDINV